MPTKPKLPWECPKCMATDGHGEGDKDECRSRDTCEGLICECWENHEPDSDAYRHTEATDHGQVFDNVCTKAVCHHCGWSGRLPLAPKKLLTWEKKALEAGWTPPEKSGQGLMDSAAAIRDLVKALDTGGGDYAWVREILDRHAMGDLLVHGTWSNGMHVLGAPLVSLDAYLGVPRHWRWMYHLAAAIACHVINGCPLLPDLKVRL